MQLSLILVGVLALSLGQTWCAGASSYNYLSSGSDWTGICATGTEQSPINIVKSAVVKSDKLVMTAKFGQNDINSKLTDKGMTLQMDGEFMNFEVEGVNQGQMYKRVYKALQFHYHSKAEHTIDSTRYDLEMHVVCEETKESRDALKFTDARTYGVFTLMFKAGANDSPLFKMINFSKKGEQLDINMYNGLYSLMTKASEFMRYPGSLTTPTCNELVWFHIVDHVYELSTTQLNEFRAIFNGNSKFQNSVGNYRVIQSQNSRVVEKGALKTQKKNAFSLLFKTISVFIVIAMVIIQ